MANHYSDEMDDDEGPEFKVESGFPVPFKGRWRGLLDSMKVGDSFGLPAVDRLRIANAITHMQKIRTGLKFTVRKVPEGYRCWRVS